MFRSIQRSAHLYSCDGAYAVNVTFKPIQFLKRKEKKSLKKKNGSNCTPWPFRKGATGKAESSLRKRENTERCLQVTKGPERKYVWCLVKYHVF